MELKKLIKSTSFLISTRFAQFFVGTVRAKINAIFLGTEGIGIVSQLDFLSQRITQITQLSMNDAIVKQIAENRDKDNIKDVICSSLKSYILLVFFL